MLSERAAGRILMVALETGQAAELVEVLLSGGSVTLDPFTGRLLLAGADDPGALVRQRRAS